MKKSLIAVPQVYKPAGTMSDCGEIISIVIIGDMLILSISSAEKH